MATPPKEIRDRLLALLTQQLNMYQELKRVFESQHKAAQDQDVEQTAAAIGAAQGLIERIQTATDELEPLRQAWDQVRDEISEADRQPLLEVYAEIGKVVQAGLELGQESKRFMEAHSEEINRKLQDLSRAKQAAQAYGRSTPGTPGHPMFTDEQR